MEPHDLKAWRPCISYERISWLLFAQLTRWFVADRFVGHVWMRDTIRPGSFSRQGSRSFGGDRRDIIEGPFFVKFYDVVARISGRFTMLGLNGLMFVFMHALHFRAMECGWLTELVDFTDEHARHRVHKCLGWGVVIATLVHIWSILFPCVFHGYGVKIVPGSFDLPFSERAPSGFKHADNAKKVMSLQLDDCWRLFEISVEI